MVFKYNDGGRKEAGFKGYTGDCFVRAVTIATEKPYKEVYDDVNTFGAKQRLSKKKKSKSSARTGIYTSHARKYMKKLGWVWIPTMFIGSGCKVHLKTEELPKGRIVAVLSKHFAAVIDGELNDTFDSSRNETRCVYGYFRKEIERCRI